MYPPASPRLPDRRVSFLAFMVWCRYFMAYQYPNNMVVMNDSSYRYACQSPVEEAASVSEMRIPVDVAAFPDDANAAATTRVPGVVSRSVRPPASRYQSAPSNTETSDALPLAAGTNNAPEDAVPGEGERSVPRSENTFFIRANANADESKTSSIARVFVFISSALRVTAPMPVNNPAAIAR